MITFDVGAEVATPLTDVREIVGGRPAGVDAQLARYATDHRLDLAAEGVVQRDRGQRGSEGGHGAGFAAVRRSRGLARRKGFGHYNRGPG